MLMADVPPTVIGEHREARQGESVVRIHEMIAKTGIRGRRAFVSVAQGDPSSLSLEQEKLLHADLIVAGKHGRSAMADFLLGSVSRRLLAGSSCDVLIIPSTAVDSLRAGAAAVPVQALRDVAASPAPRSAHARTARGARDGAQRRLAW
jgi:hypothetical protein